MLVSTARIASFAPRNNMPDVRSSRKALKLAAPPNLFGSRMSVERRDDGEIFTFFYNEYVLPLITEMRVDLTKNG